MSSPLLAVPPVAPICFPAGYDPVEIARPFHDSRWRQTDGRGRPVWTAAGAAYRRGMTAHSPIHFALTYLGPYLEDQKTGEISFAEAHMALAEIIAEAARPGPSRHAFVGSRRLGKSMWTTLLGPVFLLAHEYRKYFHLFMRADPQASAKVKRIVNLLKGVGPAGRVCAPLLLADFPHLRPIGSAGEGRMLLDGGAIIAGRGLGAATLGEGDIARPDILAVDDVQHKESANTPDMVIKAKSDIRTVLMPMNDEAAFWLTGTVTMPGDLMDDVVRAARREQCRSTDDQGAWLRAGRIDCHYYPTDWPQRWSPEKLAAQRATDLHSYALEHEPHLLGTVVGDRRFTADLWRRDPYFPTARRIISIDPAVTRGPKADFTAISVQGVDQAGQVSLGRGRTVIEHVEQGHYDLEEIKARIWELWGSPAWRIRPDVVLWERNQGGTLTSDQLTGLPQGVTLITHHSAASKRERIEVLHAQVKRGAVWLGDQVGGRLSAFEGQAGAWTPAAKRDDMLDAVSAGERFLRTGRADM